MSIWHRRYVIQQSLVRRRYSPVAGKAENELMPRQALTH